MIEHRNKYQIDDSGPGVAPQDDPAVWWPRLDGLVRLQRDLCRRIEGLSDRQTGLVQSGDTEGLLRVLAERQSLLDELVGLHERMGPFRAKWEEFLDRLPVADRGALRQSVAELKRSVASITARDDADRVELERRRAAIAGELGDVGRGRGAIAAYAASPGRARFQDREG